MILGYLNKHTGEPKQYILQILEDIIGNVLVNPLIPGDGGYALLRWLLRPYNFTPALTVAEQRFLIILKVLCGKSIWVIKRHVKTALLTQKTTVYVL